MQNIESMATDFLNEHCFAVAGVSTSRETPANFIFKRLKLEGKRVYAVNVKGGKVGNDVCYPDIASLPETPEGVVIVTRPSESERVVAQCVERGVKRVWMHRATGTTPPEFLRKADAAGSVSDRAVQLCREHNIAVIPGGCPMQFGGDFGHACMKGVLKLMGAMKV